MTERGPTFWTQHPGEVELEGDGFDILRSGRRILLALYSPWRAELAALARKHRVNCIDLAPAAFTKTDSADFLVELPPPRELHVVLNDAKDLSAITQLAPLEYLGVMGNVWANGAEHARQPADLSRLKKLKQAYLELCPLTDLILRCGTIEKLWVRNSAYRKTRALDLTGLPALRELHVTEFPQVTQLDLTGQPALERLHVEAIPKLRSLKLNPRAQVRSLKLGACGPFRIDWRRMAEELEELELVGPLRFPMEDVLQAPNLSVFRTHSIRTFPPLKFLLKLPKLREFSQWTTPPGPKWSEEDWRVYRQINERRRASVPQDPLPRA